MDLEYTMRNGNRLGRKEPRIFCGVVSIASHAQNFETVGALLFSHDVCRRCPSLPLVLPLGGNAGVAKTRSPL